VILYLLLIPPSACGQHSLLCCTPADLPGLARELSAPPGTEFLALGTAAAGVPRGIVSGLIDVEGEVVAGLREGQAHEEAR
jgi:hypothetical protein